MASEQQKAFCVLEFAKCQSAITVQRAFCKRFDTKTPPSDNSIRRWHKRFQDKGYVLNEKVPGRPKTSQERVDLIKCEIERNPMKSTRGVSRKLGLPQTTVWRVMRKNLSLKPYRYQLLQAQRPGDTNKRMRFCQELLDALNEVDFESRLVFSDESTFHLSGKVNRNNLRIWGTERPNCCAVECERDSPKINVFCAVSKTRCYGPFFFTEDTVTGNSYLNMLEQWLMPQLHRDSSNFIFQQDGAPPHWHLEVRRYLNNELPRRWIGRTGMQDLSFGSWPPRSPDLTPCDFFLWGYVKDAVYQPPLPTSLDELKRRIQIAIESVTAETLDRVWESLRRRLQTTLDRNGGFSEH